MNSSGLSSIEDEDLARFRRHGRAGLIMTLVGAAIVISSLVYSGRSLVNVQAERTALQGKLVEANLELKKVRTSAEEAKAELDQIQRGVKAARSSFYFVQLGIRQFSVKDYSGAVQLYDQALVGDSSNPIVYDLRGYALLRSGNIEAAIASLEKSISLAPDYVWGHYNLALAYGKNGQTAQAIQQLRTVVKLDPSMRNTIKSDGQFRIIRDLPEFKELIGQG